MTWKNPEIARQYYKAYKQKHKEYIRERSKEYYQRNKEEISAKTKARRMADPDNYRRWYRRNLDYFPRITQKIRAEDPVKYFAKRAILNHRYNKRFEEDIDFHKFETDLIALCHRNIRCNLHSCNILLDYMAPRFSNRFDTPSLDVIHNDKQISNISDVQILCRRCNTRKGDLNIDYCVDILEMLDPDFISVFKRIQERGLNAESALTMLW